MTIGLPLLIIDGNSIPAGNGATDPSFGFTRVSWASLGSGANYNYTNQAVPGYWTPEVTAKDVASVYALLEPTALVNIIVFMEIGNDFASGPGVGDQAACYANYVLWYNGWRAAAVSAGCSHNTAIIYCHPTPRNGSPLNPPWEACRDFVKAQILANVQYDEVAHMGDDSTFGVDGEQANTALYVDTIHPTNLGHSLFAPYLTSAIRRVVSRMAYVFTGGSAASLAAAAAATVDAAIGLPNNTTKTTTYRKVIQNGSSYAYPADAAACTALAGAGLSAPVLLDTTWGLP